MYWEDSDYTRSATKYYHHSKASGRYPDNDESLLIYIPWTYREKLKFKIVYNMNNAALRYADCSELYLSLYSGNTIKKLNSYKAQILIPNNIMPSTYYAYTYGTAKSNIPFIESSDLNSGYYTFAFELDKSDLKFNYHNRYIEFCLLAYGNDRHIFTKNAPANYYTYQNALDECIKENEHYVNLSKTSTNIKVVLLISSIAISLLLIDYTKQKYNKLQNKYTFYEPEIDYEYFREIPSDLDPLFASELVFLKDPFNENMENKEEYAAILLSLVRKKYVKLSKIDSTGAWTTYNTNIIVEPIKSEPINNPLYYDNSVISDEGPIYKTINANTQEEVEPLTTSERLYFELLERHTRSSLTSSISLHQFQTKINTDYEYTNSFVKDIEKKPALECGVMQGYFQDISYDKPKKQIDSFANFCLGSGIILLTIVNLISYFTPLALAFGAYTILGFACIWAYTYLHGKTGNLILFTQYGANEQAKWRGLYNFLNSDTLINEKEIQDVALWEKYLIYATAFGISEKVESALKIHAKEIALDQSPILNTHSYIHTTHFHSTSRSFGRSIHTSSRGGGFGGHGYGGGGRGGGGGGGGH